MRTVTDNYAQNHQHITSTPMEMTKKSEKPNYLIASNHPTPTTPPTPPPAWPVSFSSSRRNSAKTLYSPLRFPETQPRSPHPHLPPPPTLPMVQHSTLSPLLPHSTHQTYRQKTAQSSSVCTIWAFQCREWRSSLTSLWRGCGWRAWRWSVGITR